MDPKGEGATVKTSTTKSKTAFGSCLDEKPQTHNGEEVPIFQNIEISQLELLMKQDLKEMELIEGAGDQNGQRDEIAGDQNE